MTNDDGGRPIKVTAAAAIATITAVSNVFCNPQRHVSTDPHNRKRGQYPVFMTGVLRNCERQTAQTQYPRVRALSPSRMRSDD